MWVAGVVRRRGGRFIGTIGGVAVAVALLASIGSFVGSSRAAMTRRATATVAVDWQVEAQPGIDPVGMLDVIQHTSGVRDAVPVEFGRTSGLEATVDGTTQTTGPGTVVGLPPSYNKLFPTVQRPLAGAVGGVSLAQQTAANLHAGIGDTVKIGRNGPSGTPFEVRVEAIVDLPQADSLFQHVGIGQGGQAVAPPDNVVLMPEAMWHTAFDELGADRPDLVRHQVHVRLTRHLPHDPVAAFASAGAAAHHLEARLSGGGLVGDNLAATLDAARGDALYAEVLFVLLGAPGAVLAGILTTVIASVGADRRRRELALLQARGATTEVLVRLALAEAAVVALLGGLVGLGLAAVIGRIAFGSATFGGTARAGWQWSIASVAAGLVIALGAVAFPVLRHARQATVVESRRTVRREGRPTWARMGIDLWLMAAAGVVFWLTARGGYNLVLAPEGVPAISVSYWSLAGPVLLWIAGGMLLWRLAYGLLSNGRRIAVVLRPLAGPLAGVAGAALSRRRRPLAGVVAVFGLTVTFATSTAVFTSTYRRQVDVDARLTNGADVAVAIPSGARDIGNDAKRLASLPGVRHVEPLQHRFAYVGSDLQDLYGVRPATIGPATRLQDSYFVGGTSRQLLARLNEHPDSILVSAETVKDFALRPGDLMRLRLRSSDGRLSEVPFHYAGVAKEFPTAPRDSFLIANASYVAAKTGDSSPGSFLLDTGHTSPTLVAAAARRMLGPTASVTDVNSQRKLVGSSLTAVDLEGLAKVELGFALALAATAAGLVLLLRLAERRRTFAITGALGARPSQIGVFVRSEAALATLAGLILGAPLAAALSYMLVRVLNGVFDPAPTHLSVSWTYLGALAAVVVVASGAASETTIAALRRPSAEAIRDL